MAAPSIVRSNRFWRPGISKSLYLPAIVATNLVPTRAEINAGTDLSPEIASIGAWQVQSNFLDGPDLGSPFASQVTAATQIQGAEIGFYEDKLAVDVRGLLPRGTLGFHVLMYGGDVAGRLMNIFKITVGSASPAVTLNDIAQIPVLFAVTAEPAENKVIPA
jgi:hypothetical protein